MTQTYTQAAQRLQNELKQLQPWPLSQSSVQHLQRYAGLIDAYFLDVYGQSSVGPTMQINKNPYAFVALGGYGRREQCLHSDVDLLILFKDEIPDTAETLVREMVYPLWDIGLDVGYAMRTLDECLTLAFEDFEILTPLLDSRCICGISSLFFELNEQLEAKLAKKAVANKVIDWLVDVNAARQMRFGDSSFLLEPNVKEGKGGLRDFHTLLWIDHVRHNARNLADIEAMGHISKREYNDMLQALNFIWNVRNRIHAITGRKYDRLLFEHQLQIAADLGIEAKGDQRAVEVFLGQLHAAMEYVKQQYLIYLYEEGLEKKRQRRRMAHKMTHVKGLEAENGRIVSFSDDEDPDTAIVRNPELLMHIFAEAANLQLPIGSEARRLITQWGDKFSDVAHAPLAVKSFEQVLTAPSGVYNVLNAMLNTGLLAKFIPEYAGITNLIQYDEYHVYPVARHSLRTVKAIKSFGTEDDKSGDPLCYEIYKNLKNRKLLLWAALLHDIGKVKDVETHDVLGAEMAFEIMLRKGYNIKEATVVKKLVADHLYLVHIATRRDINAEETALAAAAHIQTSEALRMLYLLTVADSLATGPMAWSEWKGVLLRDFFLKVLNLIEKGELVSQEVLETVAHKQQIIRDFIESQPPEQLDLLGKAALKLSPRYFVSTPEDVMIGHLKLYQKLGAKPFVWDIKATADGAAREVTVCAHDKPGLISKIAGALTLGKVNILDVQVFTWHNNIALDIFTVTPPPDLIFEDEKWAKIEKFLEKALTTNWDLAGEISKKVKLDSAVPEALRQPVRVHIDNDSSSFFSVLEVFAYDYSGLLFNITDELYKQNLNIWIAKIATRSDQVVDVFYIRDDAQQKITDDERIREVEQAVYRRVLMHTS